MQEKELVSADVNFGRSPEKLQAVYAKVISTDRFCEDTDLSTTYLGQVDMTRNIEVKAKENFPITV